MSGWLAKIRGVAGLGLIGGIVGATISAGWAIVTSVLLGGGALPEALAGTVAIWGMFGTFTAAGFAVLLAGVGSRWSFDDLGIVRVALLGAVAGAAFPLVINTLLLGSLLPLSVLPQLLPIAALGAGLGAALSSGMVVIARRSPDREIEEAEVRRLLE